MAAQKFRCRRCGRAVLTISYADSIRLAALCITQDVRCDCALYVGRIPPCEEYATVGSGNRLQTSPETRLFQFQYLRVSRTRLSAHFDGLSGVLSRSLSEVSLPAGSPDGWLPGQALSLLVIVVLVRRQCDDYRPGGNRGAGMGSISGRIQQVCGTQWRHTALQPESAPAT